MNDLLNTTSLLGDDASGTQGDIAYNWVMTVFPQEGSAYGAAFATFSGSLAFFAALLVAFHVVVGIVSSAYSGKVLGEKYHQIWAPLRVVLGFGMMIPIAGGFSAVHYLLRDVIGPIAVNLGNAPIVTYIDHLAQNGGSVRIAAGQGIQVVNDIYEREVCSAVWGGIYENVGLYETAKSVFSYAQFPKPEGNQSHVTGSNTWDYGACGSLTYQFPSREHPTGTDAAPDINEKIEVFHRKRTEAIAAIIRSVRQELEINTEAGGTGSEIGKYYASKAYDQLPTADNAELLIRENIIPSSVGASMTTLAEEFNDAMSREAAAIYATADQAVKDSISKRIKQYGFMAAGSYERELSRMSGMANSLANDTPVRTQINVGEHYAAPIAAAIIAIHQSRSLGASGSVASGTAQAADGLGPVDYVFASLFPNMSFMLAGEESDDPVGDMISLGHYLLVVSQTAFIILAVSSLTGIAGKLGIVGVGALGGPGGLTAGAAAAAAMSVLSSIGGALLSFLMGVILIMTVVGVVHAYVLPIMPMIMVFVMGVSWLLLFLEAAIAGILWAFSFIRMDGQDFVDRNQSPGLTLLFNLLMRPALGMLAFIGGLILIPALLNALNIIWGQSYDAQVGAGGYLGIIKYLMNLILFTYMQWHLTLRIYGLIPTIADRVGHWAGFGASHGYNDGQESHAAIGAIAAGAVTATHTGKSIASGISANMQRNTDRNQDRQIQDLAEQVGKSKGGK